MRRASKKRQCSLSNFNVVTSPQRVEAQSLEKSPKGNWQYAVNKQLSFEIEENSTTIHRHSKEE